MRVKSFLLFFLFSFSFFKLSAETLTLEDFRDMADFLNVPDFKNQMKALREEAKRKENLLK